MPPLKAIQSFRATRITTATTTTVKAAGGILHRIVIATTAAGTITVNHTVNGATVALLVLGASFPVGSYELNLECSGKIEVVTGAASDITVAFA